MDMQASATPTSQTEPVSPDAVFAGLPIADLQERDEEKACI